MDAIDTARPEVVIAVLTYRRPGDIASALPMLVEQASAVSEEARARLLVIDNDPAGSARATVTDFAAAAGQGMVSYRNETTPGIAAARNRALTDAGDADFLVFIDDDERPTDHWLANLLKTQRTYGATGVAGPVVSEYEVEPSDWISAGRFFDRRRFPTGHTLEAAATNNLLLDMREVRRNGWEFDVSLGLIGGSDTLFTRAIRQSGGLLTWCDEAVVLDIVPASRLTRKWVLQRALRTGNSWSLTSLMLAEGRLPRFRQRLELTARGGVRICGGAAQAAAGAATRSLGRRARGQRTVARGVGLASGAWGYVFGEYRRAS